jgi:hypothetical protein
MSQRKSILLVISLLTIFSLKALSISDTNLVSVNSISFRVELNAWHRIADFVHEPITFLAESQTFTDSIVIHFASTQFDLDLVFTEQSAYGSEAYKAEVRMMAKTDVMIRNLNFELLYDELPAMSFLKGPAAILHGNPDLNVNILPFTDKVVECRKANRSFWIVASNYADTKDVEYITGTQIHLYDNKLHFFRQFRPETGTTDLPRDCLPVS